MQAVGQIIDNKIQGNQKAQLPLLKNWEQKQGTAQASYTHHPQRGGQTT